MSADARKSCPSAPCAPGGDLIGVVGGDGRIAWLSRPLTVSAAFVEAAGEGRSPHSRFRFTSECRKRACEKWSGEACGVADILSSLDPATLPAEGSRQCPIRETCRWLAEKGPAICAACQFVVRERDAGGE